MSKVRTLIFFTLLASFFLSFITAEEAETAVEEKWIYHEQEGKLPPKEDRFESMNETYPDGKPRLSATFKNGMLHGKMRVWDKFGNLSLEKDFRDGKGHGIYRRYYPSGQIREETSLKDNKINGKCRRYYENGQLELACDYKDNMLSGHLTTYHENGKMAFNGTTKDDRGTGNFKVWHENGNLNIVGQFNEYGQVHGKVYLYNEDGTKRPTAVYNNGVTDAQLSIKEQQQMKYIQQ